MKKPAAPPKLNDLSSDSLKKVLMSSSSPELTEFVRSANFKYLSWDSLRYRTPPHNLSANEAWYAIKMSRLSAQKILPMLDGNNEPFSYWLPESTLQALHQIDKWGGGNLTLLEDDRSFFDEAKDHIVINSLMDEAIATSQLEGAVTTRDKAKTMLRSRRKPSNKSEQMILNSYKTIRMLRTLAKEELSIDMIHTIQKEITINTLDDPKKAGQFRTREDDIVVADLESGETIFVPPEAKALPERVQKLVNFANRPSVDKDFIHPLVKAAVLHFWLAYEHPYTDGNGRTARALFYWAMLRHGYWLFEFLTISRIVREAPSQYYKSFLYSEYDDNDLTYSIYFMLKATKNALTRLHRYIERKRQENAKFIKLLKTFPGINYRQRVILGHAMKHGTSYHYTINDHQTVHNISYQTARTDLLDLVRRGLFENGLSGKKYVFWPVENLNQRIMK